MIAYEILCGRRPESLSHQVQGFLNRKTNVKLLGAPFIGEIIGTTERAYCQALTYEMSFSEIEQERKDMGKINE